MERADNSKKSKFLDLERVYVSKDSNEGNNGKGKRVVGDDKGNKKIKKRKSRKEVALSSFEPKGKKSRSSLNDVSEKSNGLSQNLNKTSGLNGISLSLDGSGNIIRIPKRPRGFVGRKGHVSKQSGSSSSVDQIAGPNVELRESSITAGPSSPGHDKKEMDQSQLVVNTSNGGAASSRKGQRNHRNRRKDFESDKAEKAELAIHNTSEENIRQSAKLNSEFTDSGTDGLSSPQHAKKKEDNLVFDNGNGGSASSRKVQQNHRKKGIDLASDSVCNDTEDDEENLERNAKFNTKKDGDRLVAVSRNGGDATYRKGQQNPKKRRKGLASDNLSVAEKFDPQVDNTRNISDDSQDDEENLEQNAARMLSSRFDPRCTGRSSESNSRFDPRYSHSPTENLQIDSESPSADTASRVLRPRNNCKEKGSARTRRHFYEVVYREKDAGWFLNRRIKVFWPLDETWYDGLVSNYDEVRKLHHVKYDDRDREWISLQNERFKLLLLPSEVTGKKSKKKASVADGKLSDETKRGVTLDDGSTYSGSHLDSEPIISWLARSSHGSKSSSGLKKQKTSHSSPVVVPLLSGDARLLERDTTEVDTSACADRLTDGEMGKKSVLQPNRSPKENRLPIVYFRRRFRKNKEGPCGESVANNVPGPASAPRCIVLVSDGFPNSKEHNVSSECVDLVKMLWSLDSAGMLKLDVSLIQSKEFKTQLNLSVRPLLEYTLGPEIFGLFHLSLLLRYGTIVTTWPMVHLEVFFVDNIVGLRFFRFEVCLMRAIAFVFLVLSIFHDPNKPGKYVDLQMPLTSVRFKLLCVQDLRKQLDFAFYSFSKLEKSKWSYLDSMFDQHCLFTKNLPLSECTLDNIKALEGRSKWGDTSSVDWEPSLQGTGKKSVQDIIPTGLSKSSNVNRRQPCNPDAKHGMLLPFALSFNAAPTFFISLHLKLLMESSIACVSSLREHDPACDPEALEDTCKSTPDDCPLVECFSEDVSEVTPEGILVTSTCSKDSESVENDQEPVKPLISKDHYTSTVMSCVGANPSLNGMSVEIPAFDSFDLPKSSIDGKSAGAQRASNFAWSMSDGIVCSPDPVGPRNLWLHSRTNLSSSPIGDISPVWPDRGTNIIHSGFGNGPRKPRTQVQYTLALGASEFSSKHKAPNQNGHHPYRRIRRASEKPLSDGSSRGTQRNLELLACDANVLMTIGDRGWREFGARVVLESADQNEWRLAVKFSGSTKYSHKVHHVLQPGSTNRYTHAMMWKGGKDWALEFPDRSQWMLFKEMHEECYNRNIRAASVKNIPIPGVHLIEERDSNGAEFPYTRRSPKYFRQVETDVEMAMNPSKILYDMDSDDEQWISRNDKKFQTCEVITDELFEKTMDMFEKVSYAQQRDHFTADEIEKLMVGVGPVEVIKVIYQHWQQKRQGTGMPLIRQLQPPLWEKYQQQVKEWEQSKTKPNNTSSLARGGGDQSKAGPPVEKPAMFAFCLKPRGLEVPNKGSKHRSHRRLPVANHSQSFLGDQYGAHTFGRRLNDEYSDTSPTLRASSRIFLPRDAGSPRYFSLNTEGSEWNNNNSNRPKFHRSKLKKIGTHLHPSNLQMVPSSHNQRTMGTRNGLQRWNTGLPEWPSQKPQQSAEVSLRHGGVEWSGGPDVDEFRLRDASGVARHTRNTARLKREKAQRLLYRADLAIHKAVSSLMAADAVEASCADSNGGSKSDESMSE